MSEQLRAQVLIVEDDADHADVMAEALRKFGHVCTIVGGVERALDELKHGTFDVVVTDLRMPTSAGVPAVDGQRVAPDGGDAGLAVLRAVRKLQPQAETIMVTAHGDVPTARAAFKEGAYDFIEKPLDLSVFRTLVNRAADTVLLRHEASGTGSSGDASGLGDLVQHEGFEGIVAGSEPMRRILRTVKSVAATALPVLIRGESGTGKELIARALHQHSPRCDRPFVPVNVAAIPAQLIESELFGHKKGAFTDAHANRDGMFAEASGGTIFLDEIAELAPALQAKLLRVLQEHEIRPIGAAKAELIDVRVVAATHRNLESMLKQGLFREDLYYRLNVIEIHLPPLRARPEDILPLADHILASHSARRARRYTISREAQQYLLNYYWPGNIRELQNVIERAVALSRNDVISQDDLPAHVQEKRSSDFLAAAVARRMSISELERDYILRVLDEEAGNKSRAAARLGLDRKTLYRKLDEYAKDEPPRES